MRSSLEGFFKHEEEEREGEKRERRRKEREGERREKERERRRGEDLRASGRKLDWLDVCKEKKTTMRRMQK